MFRIDLAMDSTACVCTYVNIACINLKLHCWFYNQSSDMGHLGIRIAGKRLVFYYDPTIALHSEVLLALRQCKWRVDTCPSWQPINLPNYHESMMEIYKLDLCFHMIRTWFRSQTMSQWQIGWCRREGKEPKHSPTRLWACQIRSRNACGIQALWPLSDSAASRSSGQAPVLSLFCQWLNLASRDRPSARGL